MSGRIIVFLYGTLCYIMFLGVFLYAIGFIGNIMVPNSLDAEPRLSFWTALAINVALLAVFALQHSIMARKSFKKWWTRYVPKAAERSTYVLFTNVALALMFWQWQPMGGTVWAIEHPAGKAIMYGVFAFGWLIVLASTFMINHFDLFGMRQVWLHLRGKEYTPLKFRTPFFYKHIRHPLYLGWFCAFWGTPTMSMAHFVFAVMTTAYILIAIQLEERDLMNEHGRKYMEWRKITPMFIPRLRTKPASEPEAARTDTSAA
ncbi:MAG: isoprenylcysteine carboxylmethyltransferase family protein [Candidatus Hydrogenedentes bacterium]|nr:isoprenylcysteine carboxylmethyltransferase family protein [Candidatus Hydrogenedentota bacterium]